MTFSNLTPTPTDPLVVRLIFDPVTGYINQLVSDDEVSDLTQLDVRRVERPVWAREPSFNLEGELTKQQEMFVRSLRPKLFDALQVVLVREIENGSASGEPHDFFFPNRVWMTGEYYVSDEWYKMEEGFSFRCIISCHFLEKAWLEEQSSFDYLGEDIFIEFNASSMRFDMDGAHGNISAI